jgi:predicted DNA-binding transcriptional regulator YafY
LRGLSAFGTTVAAAAQKSAAPSSKAGWVRVTIPIETVKHASGELLKLGVDAQVVEPAELRDRMRQMTQAMAALYRS